MNIETCLNDLQSILEHFSQSDTPLPSSTAQQCLAEVRALSARLNGLSAAFQRVADVNAALALISQLFAASHDEKFDADQVWCLIDPLRERLDGAVEKGRLMV